MTVSLNRPESVVSSKAKGAVAHEFDDFRIEDNLRCASVAFPVGHAISTYLKSLRHHSEKALDPLFSFYVFTN